MPDSKQNSRTGQAGEDAAVELLRRRGDRIVARNAACPLGEIDIVSWHGATLVFCEVRTRRSMAFGSPAETVNAAKQQKIRRAAEWYCAKAFGGKALPACRFDVVWIVMADGRVQQSGIIEGAFV